jgi:hypothetical protein
MTGPLLEYISLTSEPQEETMAPITIQLLHSVSQELSRIPIDQADLGSAAAQLNAQVDALLRLDDLDLLNVEPATVFLPPSEDSRGPR